MGAVANFMSRKQEVVIDSILDILDDASVTFELDGALDILSLAFDRIATEEDLTLATNVYHNRYLFYFGGDGGEVSLVAYVDPHNSKNAFEAWNRCAANATFVSITVAPGRLANLSVGHTDDAPSIIDGYLKDKGKGYQFVRWVIDAYNDSVFDLLYAGPCSRGGLKLQYSRGNTVVEVLVDPKMDLS